MALAQASAASGNCAAVWRQIPSKVLDSDLLGTTVKHTDSTPYTPHSHWHGDVELQNLVINEMLHTMLRLHSQICGHPSTLKRIYQAHQLL